MPKVDLNKLKDELKSFGFKESVYLFYLLNQMNNTCLRADIPEEYGILPDLSMTLYDFNYSYFIPATFDVITMYAKAAKYLELYHIKNNKYWL